MNFLKKFFRNKTFPAKDILYKYTSYNYSSVEDLEASNLEIMPGWECWEVRPSIIINDKYIRGRFKIVGKKCFIFLKDKNFNVPLRVCSFYYKTKYYHHKKINWKRRRDEECGTKLTPSHYGEYHVFCKIKGGIGNK